MNTAEHLERHLGKMQRGWSSSSRPGVHVCIFPGQPFPDVTTLATLGLSETVLPMSGGRKVRQELLMAMSSSTSFDELGKLLFHIADIVIEREQALLRGDVIHLGTPILEGSVANALYASMPVMFPDGLATLNDSVPPTVFVWLIPLHPSEASFAKAHGWSKFEDRIETAEPDLFDPFRESIIATK